MTGYVEWSADPCRGGVRCCPREILQTRFYAVSVYRGENTPSFLLRCRLRKAARALRRQGVSRAVFPAGFSAFEVFQAAGVQPTAILPLLRALAPELACCAVREAGRSPADARIAVCGPRLTSELAWAAEQLCLRSRYLLLAAPDPGGAFCRRLRREYGAAVVQTEDKGRVAAADVCVLFAPWETLEPGGAVLELYGENPQTPLCLTGGKISLPDGCDTTQMLAALYAAEAVSRAEIAAGILSNTPKADSTA